jgi:hypothetical protein
MEAPMLKFLSRDHSNGKLKESAWEDVNFDHHEPLAQVNVPLLVIGTKQVTTKRDVLFTEIAFHSMKFVEQSSNKECTSLPPPKNHDFKAICSTAKMPYLATVSAVLYKKASLHTQKKIFFCRPNFGSCD